MKKLLIITGDLACGKSTFAKLLSARYNAHLFRKDDIKEILGDNIGFADRTENRRLSVAAVELMRYNFIELSRFGADVILEANFRTDELIKLHDAAKESGYDVCTLVLRADNEILFARYMNRIENENRHPVHLSVGLTDLAEFTEYIEEQRREYIPGKTLTVCADDFSFETDEELLSRIDSFMTGTDNENDMDEEKTK